MQTDMEVVRAFYVAVDSGNLEKAGQLLSDDFKLFGTTSGWVGKHEALEILTLLKTALPDLRHALSNIRSEGGVVMLTAQGGGRHTGPLDLPNLGMGMGIIPASGRMVIFPPDHYEFTVSQGKITTERNVTPITPHSGVDGFLKAVGIPGQ
ncbi:MAG: hypothetical protein A2W35_09935 [Chloroflexi bacterium RBG_16_57_11]|nr:MAG: hypothetical protein A2W35_09935 [Chloroflexi bacterium RBG_16_57_11]